MNRILKRIGKTSLAALGRVISGFDRAYLGDDIPDNARSSWEAYLSEIQPGLRILEIGSREVIGPSSVRHLFGGSEYVGFDYYPGSNVDVAGDVHQLSSYFSPDEKFDLIFSLACFEHFAMPWIVAPQIAKMLKVGGIVYVATHFSYAAHERPWNFFQFSDMGLRVLFPECMGFECIAAGMSDPIVGRFSSLAAEWDRYKPIRAMYGSSQYFGRKVREVENFDWKQVSIPEVVGGTSYPLPRR